MLQADLSIKPEIMVGDIVQLYDGKIAMVWQKRGGLYHLCDHRYHDLGRFPSDGVKLICCLPPIRLKIGDKVEIIDNENGTEGPIVRKRMREWFGHIGAITGINSITYKVDTIEWDFYREYLRLV